MIRLTLAISLAISAATPAFAVSQANVPTGGTMVSTCSGRGFSGLPNMGFEITPTSERTCYTYVSPTGAPLSFNTSASGTIGTGDNAHNYYNFSNAAVGVGGISLSATNNGSSATAFSGSQAMGGWTDGITISGAQGATGLWIVPIVVKGLLTATGTTALSQLEIYAFLNGVNPSIHTNATAFNLFQTLNAPLVTGDANGYPENQAKSYREIDNGMADYVPISQTTSFVIPFTYNVEFTLGIFAVVGAGESSNGGFIADNVGTAGATITWGGPGYVSSPSGLGSSPPGTITSRSGYNYNVAADVPEPAAWAMMMLGFGMLGATVRAGRRQRPMRAC